MNYELILSSISSIGIIGALIYTAKQNSSLEKEMKLQAYNTTIDRIYQIRTLLIQEDELHKVFHGGIEGDVQRLPEEAIEVLVLKINTGESRYFFSSFIWSLMLGGS